MKKRHSATSEAMPTVGQDHVSGTVTECLIDANLKFPFVGKDNHICKIELNYSHQDALQRKCPRQPVCTFDLFEQR